MQNILLTYWPVIGFMSVHGIGLLWFFASLSGRVRQLEKQFETYRNVHERLAKLEATSFAVAESVRRIEAHLLRMKG